jgi:hypothetical protein
MRQLGEATPRHIQRFVVIVNNHARVATALVGTTKRPGRA